MSLERQGLFEFNNQDVTVVGGDLEAGDQATEFKAIAKDWSSVNALESTQGKVRIIGSLPSLNTSVYDWKDKVVYAAYTPVLGDEPGYAEVLKVAQKALG